MSDWHFGLLKDSLRAAEIRKQVGQIPGCKWKFKKDSYQRHIIKDSRGITALAYLRHAGNDPQKPTTIVPNTSNL
jgi:hypothetical protein